MGLEDLVGLGIWPEADSAYEALLMRSREAEAEARRARQSAATDRFASPGELLTMLRSVEGPEQETFEVEAPGGPIKFTANLRTGKLEPWQRVRTFVGGRPLEEQPLIRAAGTRPFPALRFGESLAGLSPEMARAVRGATERRVGATLGITPGPPRATEEAPVFSGAVIRGETPEITPEIRARAEAMLEQARARREEEAGLSPFQRRAVEAAIRSGAITSPGQLVSTLLELSQQRELQGLREIQAQTALARLTEGRAGATLKTATTALSRLRSMTSRKVERIQSQLEKIEGNALLDQSAKDLAGGPLLRALGLLYPAEDVTDALEAELEGGADPKEILSRIHEVSRIVLRAGRRAGIPTGEAGVGATEAGRGGPQLGLAKGEVARRLRETPGARPEQLRDAIRRAGQDATRDLIEALYEDARPPGQLTEGLRIALEAATALGEKLRKAGVGDAAVAKRTLADQLAQVLGEILESGEDLPARRSRPFFGGKSPGEPEFPRG